MYLTSYVDGKIGVETLDGFSDQALDYIENIYEYYYEITGYDGTDIYPNWKTSSDGNWNLTCDGILLFLYILWNQRGVFW